MNITQKSSVPLEILIATMNRTSLDFLDAMFKNVQISECHLLIVNQTTPDALLVSTVSNIRVINSFEKGLSKSRNLAIENAIGDICLLADDDVIFLEGFDKIILQSYSMHKNVDVLTFQTLNRENNPYSKYPKIAVPLASFNKYVLSIEISFRRLSIVNNGVRFNEHFGLGATFEDSENYIFLTDLKSVRHIKLMFIPEFIVMHEPTSSSNDIGSDRLIYARSALNYRYYGNSAYIYIAKLIFFLLRKKMITSSEIKHKLKIAHSGIETYKKLNIP